MVVLSVQKRRIMVCLPAYDTKRAGRWNCCLLLHFASLFSKFRCAGTSADYNQPGTSAKIKPFGEHPQNRTSARNYPSPEYLYELARDKSTMMRRHFWQPSCCNLSLWSETTVSWSEAHRISIWRAQSSYAPRMCSENNRIFVPSCSKT